MCVVVKKATKQIVKMSVSVSNFILCHFLDYFCRRQIVMFLTFSQKTDFDIPQVKPKETVCMKCQNQLSPGKIRNIYFKISFAEIFNPACSALKEKVMLKKHMPKVNNCSKLYILKQI